MNTPSNRPGVEALLLDLGNVVMELDAGRTFRHWARRAGVDEALLRERWLLCEDYEAHEIGAIDFEAYIDSLSDRLGIRMSLDDWRVGWNDLFVGPFPQVQTRLETLAGRVPLYAFTNTNPTHETAWRARFSPALVHFDEIYVSSTIGMRKPHVDAYHWVAQDMQMAPEKILFLDDNQENIDGARAAGLQTARIRGEQDVIEALRGF